MRFRQALATNEKLARRVALHDRQIAVLFEKVDKLLHPPESEKKQIGFK